jgi:hypothetical protein
MGTRGNPKQGGADIEMAISKQFPVLQAFGHTQHLLTEVERQLQFPAHLVEGAHPIARQCAGVSAPVRRLSANARLATRSTSADPNPRLALAHN